MLVDLISTTGNLLLLILVKHLIELNSMDSWSGWVFKTGTSNLEMRAKHFHMMRLVEEVRRYASTSFLSCIGRRYHICGRASNDTPSWLRRWARKRVVVWEDHIREIHRGSSNFDSTLRGVQLSMVKCCVYCDVSNSKLVDVRWAALFLLWWIIFGIVNSLLQLWFLLID